MRLFILLQEPTAAILNNAWAQGGAILILIILLAFASSAFYKLIRTLIAKQIEALEKRVMTLEKEKDEIMSKYLKHLEDNEIKQSELFNKAIDAINKFADTNTAIANSNVLVSRSIESLTSLVNNIHLIRNK